jgi:hypothetical protein
MKKWAILLSLLCLITSCGELPPPNVDNLCAIFHEKPDWYVEAKQVSKRWRVSVPVLMAIMEQESRFVADARPPRMLLFGFIPWLRTSSAYGYAQAIDSTWDDYQDGVGSFISERDNFADGIDFIGWYINTCRTQLGISVQDTKNLYLAYYIGLDGYARRSHLKKMELQKTAAKVARRAVLFQNQLSKCQMN